MRVTALAAVRRAADRGRSSAAPATATAVTAVGEVSAVLPALLSQQLLPRADAQQQQQQERLLHHLGAGLHTATPSALRGAAAGGLLALFPPKINAAASAPTIHISAAQQQPLDAPGSFVAASATAAAASAASSAAVSSDPLPGYDAADPVDPVGPVGREGSNGAAATATATATAAMQVPVVPGTLFRVAAGRAAVRVEHVAGWSDVATLRGRPAGGGGGGSWAAVAAPASAGTTVVGSATSSADVRQVYDVVRQEVRQEETSSSLSDGGDDGALVLAVPEKWISLDIRTTGGPGVAVSKISEADLRATTGGAAVTLGSVRALRVELDTAAFAPGGGGGGGGGSITGGEVSGTSISISAGGPIRVRRLVGGTMRVRIAAAAAAAAGGDGDGDERVCTTAAGTAGAGTAAAAQADGEGNATAIGLGAVYGGRLQVSTGGGAVRIGTLDCGGAAAAAATTAAATAPATEVSPSYDGAEILSYGGAITLDGLEGDAAVDSAGGAIKVLVQPGLRSARLVSGGGPVDLALAPGTALRRLEVRGAGEVTVHSDLQRHLLPLEALKPSPAPAPPPPEAAGGSSGSSSPAGVWVATLGSDVESGGRGAAGRSGGGVGGGGGIGGDGDGDGAGRRPAAGGELVVDAGGGAVSLRRLGWLEALRAKMEEGRARAGQTGGPQRP